MRSTVTPPLSEAFDQPSAPAISTVLVLLFDIVTPITVPGCLMRNPRRWIAMTGAITGGKNAVQSLNLTEFIDINLSTRGNRKTGFLNQRGTGNRLCSRRKFWFNNTCR